MKARTPRRASFVAGAVTTLLAANASCRYPATEVVVVVDTDAPVERPLTLRVTVEAGAGTMLPTSPWREWHRGSASGEVSLPASFAVVPADNGARDATVTVHIEGLVGGSATSSEVRIVRLVRFAFQPRQANVVRVFLPMRCADPATACTSVQQDQCTIGVRCEEQGLTCGDRGDCVRPDEVTLAPFQPDAALVNDVGTSFDAADSSDALDASDITDITDVPDVVDTTDAMDAVDAIDAVQARPNVAFITSTNRAGNFGGVDVANAECRARATAAGLPGNFVALLGTTMQAPLAALAGSRGWVDVRGLPIVDESPAWFDLRMFHPLRRTEDGTLLPPVQAWLNGCGDFTSALATDRGGIVGSLDVFNEFTVYECDASLAFVCVEIGNVATVRPQITTGRVAFVSSGWVPGGGLASADNRCAMEASAAGLSGSYRALLTTSTQDAFSRFSASGATWTRPDGIAIVPTAADLVGPTPRPDFDSFLSLHADGTPAGVAFSWIGSSTANCSDWTIGDASRTGSSGSVTSAWRQTFLHVFDAGCADARALICLQE